MLLFRWLWKLNCVTASHEKTLELTEATRTEGKVCNWSHLRLSVFQEKPLGKVGRRVGKTNKVSQNDRLFSLFLHNWKERILLRTRKNTNNKFIFLCVYWILNEICWTAFKVLICKNHEWIVLIYLAKQSHSRYVLPPWIASCERRSAEAGLDSQLFPLLPLLVCSSLCLPTFSWGMRDAFHFLETSGCAVQSVVSWGMAARGFWTAAQGRPGLMAHEP